MIQDRKNQKNDLKNIIDDALKHEENLQHDENEEPITFVNKKQVKSIEHEDHVLNDENEELTIFAEDI